MSIRWGLGFVYQRGSFRCCLFLILKIASLILIQQHLADPDSFQDTFGNNTHFFTLKRVIQEENIWFFRLESIDLI